MKVHPWTWIIFLFTCQQNHLLLFLINEIFMEVTEQIQVNMRHCDEDDDDDDDDDDGDRDQVKTLKCNHKFNQG